MNEYWALHADWSGLFRPESVSHDNLLMNPDGTKLIELVHHKEETNSLGKNEKSTRQKDGSQFLYHS